LLKIFENNFQAAGKNVGLRSQTEKARELLNFEEGDEGEGPKPVYKIDEG
jgi:hypothetical protein